MLRLAREDARLTFRFGITNIVACFPHEVHPVTGKREIRPPSKIEADSCRLRLLTTVEAASPHLVILLGKTAKKYLRIPKVMKTAPVIELMHPAGILRRGGLNSLDFKRNYFELCDGIRQYVIGSDASVKEKETTLET